MKRFFEVFLVSVLLTCLLINNVFAVCEWGVDEYGKFSYNHVMVFIKEEYTNEPETVIKNIESNFDVVSAEIISVTEDPEQPLVLLVKLPVLHEKYFYSIYNALLEEEYVDFVAKSYYMASEKSYLGDINQDEKIQTDDARTILMYAAGQLEPETTTQKILADADGDGAITTQDARYALLVACGII